MSAGVVIKPYKVIYELIDDVRDLMEGKIGAVDERLPLGKAEVRAVFGTGSRKVAGCYVDEGVLRKGALAVVSCASEFPHFVESTAAARISDLYYRHAHLRSCLSVCYAETYGLL